MDQKEKRSYKGFVGMIFLLFLCIAILPFLPWSQNVKLMCMLIYNICNLWSLLLTYIIYKTENIHWYSGLNSKIVAKYTRRQQEEYAWRHVKRFGTFTVIFLIYTLFSFLINVPWWIDFILYLVGIIGTAVSTMNIRLEDMEA